MRKLNLQWIDESDASQLTASWAKVCGICIKNNAELEYIRNLLFQSIVIVILEKFNFFFLNKLVMLRYLEFWRLTWTKLDQTLICEYHNIHGLIEVALAAIEISEAIEFELDK